LKKTAEQTQIPMELILPILAETYPTHPMSDVTGCDPYKVLVACIMSLRTRDDTTMPLAKKLFEIADTPEKMVKLTPQQLEKLIYPVGFYKTKAVNILDISQRLLDEYEGIVPDDIDVLTQFKGVGRKTANLVVGLGYQKPAVCVDIHVHRISNRLGYLETKTPEDTEWALREKLDPQYWHTINKVMVRHGQDCCKPIGPLCHTCPIEQYCRKVDVKPKKPLVKST
jgi:endonuclease III